MTTYEVVRPVSRASVAISSVVLMLLIVGAGVLLMIRGNTSASNWTVIVMVVWGVYVARRWCRYLGQGPMPSCIAVVDDSPGTTIIPQQEEEPVTYKGHPWDYFGGPHPFDRLSATD